MNVKEIEVTWVIIIWETPYGRFILDKNAEKAQGFTPTAVMALKKIEDSSQLDQIKKLLETQGNVKTLAMGNITDIANVMQQGLAGKRNFSNDCFSDFSQVPMPQSIPTTPPRVEGKKKAKQGAPTVEPAFGREEAQEAIVDGPVVACGKKDGVDTLQIYDASGAPMGSINKDELTEDPERVKNSLLYAASLGQRMLGLMNMNSIPKTVSAMMAEKIVPLRTENKEEKKKKKGEEMKTEPNDPLYYPDFGKKKSKVQENIKKVVANPLTHGTVQIFGASEDEESGSDINDQWGIRKIGFTPKSDPNSAWNVIDASQQNTLVAVIDSGFDMTHPDGPQFIWVNPDEVPENNIDDDNNGYVDDIHGWNFIDDNADLADDKGHGTFVAGIIAARTNNGLGIAGINPGAVIMPLKVANADGEANSVNIFRAINYAVNEGARVINISLGNRGVSQLEQSAVNYARSQGVFVAIASGNVNENIGEHGPASSLGAFTVGSLDYAGAKSTISNWGANNGLIAPGEKIYSLRSKEFYDPRDVPKEAEFYYKMSGTSFSTPMVVATVSLLLAKNSNLTLDQIEDILQAAATDLGDAGWDSDNGAGLLNAAAALRMEPVNLLTAKITKIRVNRDKNNKLESVDVWTTVRGDFDHYVIELGKGKRAGGFEQVTGEFKQPANNHWVARLDAKYFRGSQEWVIRIKTQARDGTAKTAQAQLSF